MSSASSTGEPSFQVGETTLDFVAGPGAPFYHFALLVPGNRFDAALAWVEERTTLLPEPRTGEVVFDFDFWDATACYFEDPAGNIVELVAHRGIDETDGDGAFRAAELVGLSELGLVGDLPQMAASLAHLGLAVWDGSAESSGSLAFVGEQARTLILAPRGRGWLPTGRTAEVHDVEVLLSGRPEGEVLLEGSRYRIRQSGPEEDRPSRRRTGQSARTIVGGGHGGTAAASLLRWDDHFWLRRDLDRRRRARGVPRTARRVRVDAPPRDPRSEARAPAPGSPSRRRRSSVPVCHDAATC